MARWLKATWAVGMGSSTQPRLCGNPYEPQHATPTGFDSYLEANVVNDMMLSSGSLNEATLSPETKFE
jgi:hypothetical protein